VGFLDVGISCCTCASCFFNENDWERETAARSSTEWLKKKCTSLINTVWFNEKNKSRRNCYVESAQTSFAIMSTGKRLAKRSILGTRVVAPGEDGRFYPGMIQVTIFQSEFSGFSFVHCFRISSRSSLTCSKIQSCNRKSGAIMSNLV